MDIPNLSTTPPTTIKSPENIKPLILIIFIFSGIFVGFWLSRFLPTTNQQSSSTDSSTSEKAISADSISGKENVEINKLYGNTQKTFKDSALGVIKKGGINGEGTHYLEREGGVTQRAALTSSTLDLDLFIDRQVEIHGETNSSTKTSWFLDVGSIKVLQ